MMSDVPITTPPDWPLLEWHLATLNFSDPVTSMFMQTNHIVTLSWSLLSRRTAGCMWCPVRLVLCAKPAWSIVYYSLTTCGSRSIWMKIAGCRFDWSGPWWPSQWINWMDLNSRVTKSGNTTWSNPFYVRRRLLLWEPSTTSFLVHSSGAVSSPLWFHTPDILLRDILPHLSP